MNPAALVAGIASVLAASPGDFHSIADISCPDGATGCRIELPAWVSTVQPATGDGRTWSVSTERGEALPWRDAPDSFAPSETTWADLPSIPLANLAGNPSPQRLSLAIAESRFRLQWSGGPDSSPEPTTRWIVDLRAFKGTVLEIVPDSNGNFLGSMSIEGGDDLMGWIPRGSMPLARIDSGAFSVRRLRIPLEERRDVFLRLTWNAVEGGIQLRSLRGGLVSEAAVGAARREDLGPKVRGDSGWTFDAGGRPPVVGAFVEFRRRGAYGEFVLETRSALDQAWSPAAVAFGWHRGTNDLAFHNDTVWFSGPLRERYWRVRATGSAATMGDSARLVLRIRPDHIEFPTGGAARLVFAAGMEPLKFSRRVAAIGAVPKDPPRGMMGSPRLAQGEAALTTVPDHRKWILGGTLLFAVLSLLGLAWRLWKDALVQPKTPPATPS